MAAARRVVAVLLLAAFLGVCVGYAQATSDPRPVPQRTWWQPKPLLP